MYSIYLFFFYTWVLLEVINNYQNHFEMNFYFYSAWLEIMYISKFKCRKCVRWAELGAFHFAWQTKLRVSIFQYWAYLDHAHRMCVAFHRENLVSAGGIKFSEVADELVSNFIHEYEQNSSIVVFVCERWALQKTRE